MAKMIAKPLNDGIVLEANWALLALDEPALIPDASVHLESMLRPCSEVRKCFVTTAVLANEQKQWPLQPELSKEKSKKLLFFGAPATTEKGNTSSSFDEWRHNPDSWPARLAASAQ